MRLHQLFPRSVFGRGYGNLPLIRNMVAFINRNYKPGYVYVNGCKFFLNPGDNDVSAYLALHGYYEQSTTSLMRRYVKPGWTVLDLGANIGYFTCVLSDIVGETGRVIALEPETVNFGILERNAGHTRHRNVRLLNVAAWKNSGPLRLYVSTENMGDHQCFDDHEGRESVEIEAVAIDDIITDESGIDFIKMDIQGSEGNAILGMSSLLQRNPPKLIMTEFWPSALASSGTPPEEVFAMLKRYGYTIYRIVDDRESRNLAEIDYDHVRKECDLDWKFLNLFCVQSAFVNVGQNLG